MYENVCYKKNYVNQVIVRIDFINPINDFSIHMPKSIGTAIKEFYPIVEPKDVIGTELLINSNGNSNIGNISKQWVFNTRDRKNQCIILPENIIFNFQNYDLYDDMKKIVIEIINNLIVEYPNVDAKRFGVRYINTIPLSGDTTLIKDDIINPINAYREMRLKRALTTIEYNIEENDLNIRNQYGFLNKDYPAVMNTDDFTIDIDAYTSGLIYLDEIYKIIDQMHNEIQRMFENSITDKLREQMNTL